MHKFRSRLKLVIIAVLLAGTYGVVHDQISYSLAPEYFTRFKFLQFNLPWAHHAPRLGAAYIGVLGTWWMGLIISLPLLFLTRNASVQQQYRRVLISYSLVLCVNLIVTASALALAYQHIDEDNLTRYRRWLRSGVTDPIQFIRVGFMHNASYLGGAAGLCTALLFNMNVITRFRERRSQRNSLS